MTGLPKIALARLKGKSGALKPSGDPEGRAALPGGHHPDANLLAAFVEKTLTERERARVLHHLAQCAECREVAAFALPAEAVAAEPARLSKELRWSPGLILRWGAMAAVLGALTLVVVLHPGIWQRHQEIAKKMAPPVPAANVPGAPPAVSAPPLAPPPPEQASAQASLQPRAGSQEVGAIKKPSGARENFTASHQVARAPAQQQVTVMASTRPPAPLRVESVPAAKPKQPEATGGALAAGAPPAPPPPSAPTFETMIASQEAGRAGGGSQPGPAAFRATRQGLTVTGGNAGASSAGGATPGMATQPTAPAPMVAALASGKEFKSEAGPSGPLWSVTSEGKVQRSTDGGKTFELIPITHGIKFRAVAAFANEVWAGGTSGALFHSNDGGATWTRTGIDFGGRTVTETITGIQMHDPQHLTITTVSGSQWVSEDGGQHWR